MAGEVKITIYAPPELKEKLARAASTHEPKVSASALGVMLLELGLEAYAKKPDVAEVFGVPDGQK